MSEQGLLGVVLYRSSEAQWLRTSAIWIERHDPERARLWRWLSEELDAAERRTHTPQKRQKVNQPHA